MKKSTIIGLSILSVILLCSLSYQPVIANRQITQLNEEIEEKLNYYLEKLGFDLNIFDYININLLRVLFNIIKILIFFELGFSFYFLIVCIMEQYPIGPNNLFQIIYGFLWTGFNVFINCFYELIYQLLSLNIDLVIFYLSLFLIGFFILSLVEINPNISNYLIGSLVYGLFIYFQIYYLSKYFDFEP